METGCGEKYIGRWRQLLDLRFRVWPVGDDAHRLTWKMSRIPVHGFLMNQWGKLEAVYRLWKDEGSLDKSRRYRSFEINDDDAEVIAAVPAAGAALDLGKLFIAAPGTADSRVKQVSWLNVPIRVNPSAPGRTGSADCWSDEACPMLKCLKGTNLEDLVKGTGIEYKRILYLPTKDEVDEALILKAVLEEDAAVVFGATVPSKITNKIMRRAKYWVVDGRRPEDPGGLLKGYQFSDRIFRWYRRVGEAFDHEDHMSRMHEATREKGRSSRRKYFIDNVVNGFAELVGVSRQRVVSKFLTDGIVDWLLRSVDGIRYEQAREAKTLLKARVKDAVRALEFYYRATEGAVLPTRPTRTERRVQA